MLGCILKFPTKNSNSFEKIDLKMCRNAQINFLAVGREGDAIGIEASREQEILFVGKCAVECMHKWVDNEDFLSDLYNCISGVIESRSETKKRS